MFDFTATYLYEWDEPKGVPWSAMSDSERASVARLTAPEEGPPPVDERALAEVTARLQGAAPGHQARTAAEFFE